MAISKKWQNFWGGILSGAAGGIILVATNNLGIELGVGIGGAIGGIIILGFIYNFVVD